MKPSRDRVAGLVGTGFLLAALAGCGSPARAETKPAPATPASSQAALPPGATESSAPSLLLVTIDSWRWDYLGASGAGKVTTPNLDRLAEAGLYEREAMTSSPLTTPAHATILTGMDPLHHGILDSAHDRLDASAPTLAEAFKTSGYSTAAFLSSDLLRANLGLARGFDLYDASGTKTRRKEDWNPPKADGQEVTKAFLAYLPTLASEEKTFVWLHYSDLHLPLRPRPAYDAKYPRDNYAAQVAFVDGEVGKVVASLKADAGRSWRIVVVGDHGEGRGERGEDTHGIGLYRATLHVPLVLFPRPGAAPALAKPWGLVDVAPTIREWFGLPAAAGSDGTSLFRKGRPERFLSAMSLEPSLLFAVEPSLGVRQGSFLYLRGGGDESLYDLSSDPSEEHDLARVPDRKGDLERFRGLCDKNWPASWLAEALPRGGKVQRIGLREVMADKNALDWARQVGSRTEDEAGLRDVYARLVTKYPDSLELRSGYALLLVKIKQYQDALRVLEPAVALHPRNAKPLMGLATVYVAMRDFEKAGKALEEAREREPNNAAVYKELGVLYADHLPNPEKATAYFKKFLDLGGGDGEVKMRQYINIHGPHLKKSPQGREPGDPGSATPTPMPVTPGRRPG
jgi:arylsulfatase A-like enzyme